MVTGRAKTLRRLYYKYWMSIITEEEAEYRGIKANIAGRWTWGQILNQSFS